MIKNLNNKKTTLNGQFKCVYLPDFKPSTNAAFSAGESDL